MRFIEFASLIMQTIANKSFLIIYFYIDIFIKITKININIKIKIDKLTNDL